MGPPGNHGPVGQTESHDPEKNPVSSEQSFASLVNERTPQGPLPSPWVGDAPGPGAEPLAWAGLIRRATRRRVQNVARCVRRGSGFSAVSPAGPPSPSFRPRTEQTPYLPAMTDPDDLPATGHRSRAPAGPDSAQTRSGRRRAGPRPRPHPTASPPRPPQNREATAGPPGVLDPSWQDFCCRPGRIPHPSHQPVRPAQRARRRRPPAVSPRARVATEPAAPTARPGANTRPGAGLGRQPLAANPNTIAMYIVRCADQRFVVSSIRVHLARIKTAHPHVLAGLSLDLRHPRLAMVLEGVTRAKGTRPRRQATPGCPTCCGSCWCSAPPPLRSAHVTAHAAGGLRRRVAPLRTGRPHPGRHPPSRAAG